MYAVCSTDLYVKDLSEFFKMQIRDDGKGTGICAILFQKFKFMGDQHHQTRPRQAREFTNGIKIGLNT